MNRFQNGVIAAGTTDEIAGFKITKRSNFWDKTVGLYKYENNYYGQCSGTDIDGFVNLYNKAEAILKGNTVNIKMHMECIESMVRRIEHCGHVMRQGIIM